MVHKFTEIASFFISFVYFTFVHCDGSINILQTHKLSPITNSSYLQNFIESIRQERDFNSLYITHNYNTLNIDDPRIQYIIKMQTPRIISKQTGEIHITSKFNNEILTICIWQSTFNESYLQTVANNLNFMHSKRMLILGFQIQNETDFLISLLEWCSDEKLSNVLVHFLSANDYNSQYYYYQINPFPRYHHIKRLFNTTTHDQKIYPKHWLNMQGKVIYTLPDQIEPRSMVYLDSKGNEIITGYVGKLLLTFADRFNATLKFPYPVQQGKIIHMAKIANLTRKGVIDIGMSLYYTYTSSKWQYMSYPVELTKWLVMVPCPHPIPISETFTLVLGWELLLSITVMMVILSASHNILDGFYRHKIELISLILNINIFPAFLGQSILLQSPIETPRMFIYAGAFLLGLFVTDLYSAELKTLIITPVYSTQIKTFDDIRRTKMKILLDISDKSAIDSFSTPEFTAKIDGIVSYTEDTIAYQNYLKQFNTSYSYTITSGLWNILQEQQSYYVHPIFCAPSQLYFVDTLLMAMPLSKNSLYRDPLNSFLSRVYANGLVRAWQSDTFHDMLQRGNIMLKDKSDEIIHLPLTVNDLYQIWLILIAGLCLSALGLVIELLTDKYSFNSFKRMLIYHLRAFK